MKTTQLRVIGLLFAGALALSACSGGGAPSEDDGGPAPDATADAEDAADAEKEADASDGAGDGDSDVADTDALEEALGDRDIVLTALESALSSDNASGQWDGDVLTMSLDGDVDDEIQRFQHCRIVGGFLEDGDTLVLDYENGAIDCAEIEELEGQLIW